jgi:hypothetical protein
MAAKHPGAQGVGHFIKVSREKMIGTGNEDYASRFGGIWIKCLYEALEMRFCGVPSSP